MLYNIEVSKNCEKLLSNLKYFAYKKWACKNYNELLFYLKSFGVEKSMHDCEFSSLSFHFRQFTHSKHHFSLRPT